MAYVTPTATNLQSFLGVVSIDTDRAAYLISLAEAECQTIVTPLPDGAQGTVLEVAGRVYTNARQMQQARLGSADMQYGAVPGYGPIGGLYLSRKNKATLRRLSGGSTAFSVGTLPGGTNAVQTLTLVATGGTFTLTFLGTTTAALAYDLTAGDLATAVGAIPSIGTSNISVTQIGAGVFAIEFINNLATAPMPTFVPDATSLTGTCTVVTSTIGVYAPGQNLPFWDRDYYNGPRLLGQQVFGEVF